MRRRQRKAFEFYFELVRHPGTPESVGRGVATGFFTAFALPAGHMAVAFLLAMLVRGARGVAVLATWIINPLTVTAVYPLQCYLGGFIIGQPLSYALIRRLVSEVFHNPSFKTAGALSGQLIASFFTGGVLLGTVAAAAGYFCTTVLVRRYRARRAERSADGADPRQAEECWECD